MSMANHIAPSAYYYRLKTKHIIGAPNDIDRNDVDFQVNGMPAPFQLDTGPDQISVWPYR
jgi:hypothetical protein